MKEREETKKEASAWITSDSVSLEQQGSLRGRFESGRSVVKLIEVLKVGI